MFLNTAFSSAWLKVSGSTGNNLIVLSSANIDRMVCLMSGMSPLEDLCCVLARDRARVRPAEKDYIGF
jgi:hypothetical protein